MKRSWVVPGCLTVVMAAVLVMAATVPADASKPTLKLSASPMKCKVGTSVKFTATVTSPTTPYEIRLYKSTGGAWTWVATASQVSAGKYVAYATATPKGKLQFKAGFVNSKGSVTAYSKSVTVTVTK
jgi:hypothetical protein